MSKKKKKKTLLDWLLPPGKQAKKQEAAPKPEAVKDFLDMIAPGAVRFNSDQYILGNSYRAVYAIRSYGTSTEELALLGGSRFVRMVRAFGAARVLFIC